MGRCNPCARGAPTVIRDVGSQSAPRNKQYESEPGGGEERLSFQIFSDDRRFVEGCIKKAEVLK
jgi:hypothetical protein